MNLFRKIQSGLKPKVFIVMGIVTGSLSILMVVFLIVNDFWQDKNINEAEQKKMAYNLEQLDQSISEQAHSNLLFFENLEELNLEMELYRNTRIPWSQDDVREFWIPADRADIDYFISANHTLVWDILKDAP